MTKIEGIVERAYYEGNNIVAVCKTNDGEYLQPCVIPKGSDKEDYLKDQFGFDRPGQVSNVPAVFTTSGTSIINAEAKEDSAVDPWEEADLRHRAYLT